MDTAALKSQLKIDEGWRRFPYTDTVGKMTIGCGRNLSDVGISDNEISYLLDNDIGNVTSLLDQYLPWWASMTDVRQQALANMCFNMGISTLLTFKNTLAHMQAGEYPQAANSMLQSKWAQQVGQRAQRLAEMIRNG